VVLGRGRPIAWPWLALAALIVLLDQLTKLWALSALAEGERVPVLAFLNWRLAFNTGAAFSFLAEAGGWQQWLFGGLALVVAAAMVFLLLTGRAKAGWERFAYALVLGGAVGNLIDRVWRGAVVDFVELHYAGLYWPAFNVADASLSVAAVALVVGLMIDAARQRRLRG
jgi:signal peptidase II